MKYDTYIADESNDHKYFSLLPHYILNHSTAVDQALYMQMKRYAGEKNSGLCWASKRTLMEKLGIGIKALNTSLEYLASRGWVAYKGKKKVMTKGGEQEVDVYAIKDIWKENVAYYEGASKSTPLTKGASESSPRCSQKDVKGVAESTPNKNHYKQEEEQEKIILGIDFFKKKLKEDGILIK